MLFATAPMVVYLLVVCGLFVLAVQDLSLWTRIKSTALEGGVVALVLAGVCFALGRRISDRVEATAEGLWVHRTAALGSARTEVLAKKDILSLAIDPSLRSLGADVLLVAVLENGRRVPVAEGEPHSGQVRDFARQLGALLQRPVEAPKFTVH